MSIFSGSNPLLTTITAAGGGGGGGYEIERSLRFNQPDSAYLSRTPASAGNRKTWTWAGWVKRSALSSTQCVFTSAAASSVGFSFEFSSDNAVDLFDYSGGYLWHLKTTQVFRDPSAWQHVVLSFDSTQGTSANRVKFYANGVQVETFSTATYPSSSFDSYVNDTNDHGLGSFGDGVSNFFRGYLADVHFIDGQALDPTSFGEFDDNGIWQPIEFVATGPNNGTVWSTYGTVSGGSINTLAELFDGDLTSVGVTGASSGSTITYTFTAGISYSSSVRIYTSAGGSSRAVRINSDSNVAAVAGSWVTVASGSGTMNSFSVYTGTETDMSIAAIEVDGVILIDGDTSNIGVNGFHLPFSDNSTAAALGYDAAVDAPTLNPEGGMDVVTYTGNGGTQTIGGLAFQPDFVWIKARNQAYSHSLYDIVRGTLIRLKTNSTDPEASDSGSLTAFNSDGFTLGGSTSTNANTESYVAWCWKAGGTAVSNTDGTITSQVSASTDYGFSIVTYTGNATQGASVGHGLGVAPAMIIVKNRDAAVNWFVYHRGIASDAETDFIKLNTTDAAADLNTAWNDTAPTSTVFSIGTDGSVNQSSADHVAYCWSEVPGFSKFGSYTGNGSTDGPTVTTGFKPRWIMVKASSVGGLPYQWSIWDTSRDQVNPITANLWADSSEAEASSAVYALDVTSNGFKLKTDSAARNESGVTYIYAAFADRPGNNWDVNNLVADGGVTYSSYVTSYLNSLFDTATYPVTNLFDGSTSTIVYSSSVSGSGIKFVPPTAITGSIELYLRNGDTANSTFSYSLDNGSSFTNLTTTDGDGSYVSIGSQTIDTTNGIIVRHVTTAGTNRVNWRAIRLDGTVLTDGAPSSTDSLVDVPTNGTETDTGVGGEVRGNYCTWNPLTGSPSYTYSNGNLDLAFSASNDSHAATTIAVTSGAWYCEGVLTAHGGDSAAGGFCVLDGSLQWSNANAGSSGRIEYRLSGQIIYNGSVITTVTSYGVNDVIGIWIDATNNQVKFYKNNVLEHTQSSLTFGSYMPGYYGNSGANRTMSAVINTGQRAFVYTAPSSAKALCTANLDAPVVTKPSEYMDIALYTGNGSTQSITGLAFSPEFIWMKSRSAVYSNHLVDVVRGGTKALVSDSTASEYTSSNYVTSFDSAGFSIGNEVGINNNGTTYAAWTWDAGSSTVSNTDGSITSQVRANASAGFSIVGWNTGGSTSDFTVGHGLNATPSMFIIKNRDSAQNWDTYFTGFAGNEVIYLNLTDAKTAVGVTVWNSVTSSVLGLRGASFGGNDSRIAYCFAPVEGYSAFGSYTGNGSADGPFVFTGMRPRWILIKSSTLARGWKMYDAARDTYNACDHTLQANASDAETTASGDRVDLLSNGFKIRTAGDEDNGSGETYLYMCFAENPFAPNARAR